MDKSFKPQFDTMTKENCCAGEKWSHFLWLISGGTWNKTPLSNFILSPGAPIIHETPIRSHFLPSRNWVRLFFVSGPDAYFNCMLLLLRGRNSYWMIHNHLTTILTFHSESPSTIAHQPSAGHILKYFLECKQKLLNKSSQLLWSMLRRCQE